MPGKAAVVLTAAALSITVGVLIGIVLIVGERARQPAAVSAPTSTTNEQSSAPIDDSLPVSVLPVASTPVTTSSTPALASTPAPTSTPVTRATTSGPVPGSGRPTPIPTPTPKPAASRTTATRPAIVFTTVTVAPATSSSVVAATSATSTEATPVPTTVTTPPTRAAGGPAPGGPCAELGDKATAPGGSTVFCQRNFSNGSLAWRAVVDGGGCLSKKMTGIGADGQRYVCRPDERGLDHWRRA